MIKASDISNAMQRGMLAITDGDAAMVDMCYTWLRSVEFACAGTDAGETAEAYADALQRNARAHGLAE